MNPRIECGGLQSGRVLFCRPWTFPQNCVWYLLLAPDGAVPAGRGCGAELPAVG